MRHRDVAASAIQEATLSIEQVGAGATAEDGGRSPSSDSLPLLPESQAAAAYPVHALGTHLSAAASAIADIVQVPIAVAAQSVLAAAALIIQDLADVLLPIGPNGMAKPLSLFFVTLAESGDRKSATDAFACMAIKEHEEKALKNYKNFLEIWERDRESRKIEKNLIRTNRNIDAATRTEMLRALGPEPARPIEPVLIPNDLTFEGLVNAWNKLPRSIGLFTTEGGQFIGGYGMKGDSRINTAAGLSLFWDGGTYKRIRASDGLHVLRERRLSLHLMVQPQISAKFLNDEVLIKQGFLSRILIAAPESIVGSRLHKVAQENSAQSLSAYTDRLSGLLGQVTTINVRPDVDAGRRKLAMTQEAEGLWVELSDWVEIQSTRNGQFSDVKDVAAKAAEQAARIAGVLTLVNDHNASHIAEQEMIAASELVLWYIYEARRLRDTHPVKPVLTQAKALLDWLASRPGSEAEFVEILQLGPARTRTKREAEAALAQLVEHHLVRETAQRPRTFRVVAS